MSEKNLEFHTETGRLALDWMATLGERHGQQIERLTSCDDLARWITEVAGQALEAVPTSAEFDQAIRLRAALTRVVEACYSDKTPEARDIDMVNQFAEPLLLPKRLDPTGRAVLEDGPLPPTLVFADIARDAIDLLTGDEFLKIKLCAAQDCSVLFVDLSRPGKRRWCSMSRCGNKAKKSRFNAKPR